jgi:hypothetical protein
MCGPARVKVWRRPERRSGFHERPRGGSGPGPPGHVGPGDLLRPRHRLVAAALASRARRPSCWRGSGWWSWQPGCGPGGAAGWMARALRHHRGHRPPLRRHGGHHRRGGPGHGALRPGTGGRSRRYPAQLPPLRPRAPGGGERLVHHRGRLQPLRVVRSAPHGLLRPHGPGRGAPPHVRHHDLHGPEPGGHVRVPPGGGAGVRIHRDPEHGGAGPHLPGRPGPGLPPPWRWC